MALFRQQKESQLIYFRQIFTHYFKELEEESIKDNFVIVYELFDEVMDFGYPQFSDPKILQEYVFYVYLEILRSRNSIKLEIFNELPLYKKLFNYTSNFLFFFISSEFY